MTAAVSNSSSVSSAGLAASLMAPPAVSRGPGFAQVLSAHQAESRAPAPSAAPTPADKPVAADAPKAREPESQSPQNRVNEENRARQLRAARAGGRPQAEPAAAPRGAAADAVESDPADVVRADAGDDKTEETAVVDPAIADWLSKLNLPDAPAPAETAQAAAGTADEAGRAAWAAKAEAPAAGAEADTDAPADRSPSRRAGASSETAARQRDGVDTAASQRDAVRADTLATESPAAWQAALEQAAVPAAATPARAADGLKIDAAGALAAAQGMAAGQPAERAAEAPAPVVVHVPTPADSPEFPQALGTQLSVLAKDGIEHAELHLNPTDMGPISVQIALDGDQAKVDFGADSAATRQIIENGLPELAAALRDAGFTLSGGGVHSQAQNSRGGEGRSPGGSGGDGRGQPSADEVPAPARPISRARAGGIDLYA